MHTIQILKPSIDFIAV